MRHIDWLELIPGTRCRPFIVAIYYLLLSDYIIFSFSSQRSFEYLRLTSLGVIGALVKTDENDVITFLLTTEIVPLCLNIMDTGSELSKTVATFILQKILVDNQGLEYICAVSNFIVLVEHSVFYYDYLDIRTIL